MGANVVFVCWSKLGRVGMILPCAHFEVTAAKPANAAGEIQDSQSDHWRSCQAQSACPRCIFEAGMAGVLRKGAASFAQPNAASAWTERFTFIHPTAGRKTWLVARPPSWGSAFAIGCWVCCHFEPPKYRSTFGRLEVTSRTFARKTFFS